MTAVLELMGPAGAGKTTLLRALCAARPTLRGAPRVSRAWHAPVVLRDTLSLLPAFLAGHRHGRWFTWSEARSMVYLRAWLSLVRARAAQHDGILVLDHGPIYRLAMLGEFGPELTRSQAFRRWSDRLFASWAGTLDLMVWLDAGDEVLAGRIRGREQEHLVKTASSEDVGSFLRRCRGAFERSLARLEEDGRVRILRIDTDREPAEKIAARILEVIDSGGQPGSG